VGTSIISCGNAPPVFETTEHVFYLMALFIQGFTVSCGEISSPSRRNTGSNPFGFKGGTIFVTVITFIADKNGRTLW